MPEALIHHQDAALDAPPALAAGRAGCFPRLASWLFPRGLLLLGWLALWKQAARRLERQRAVPVRLVRAAARPGAAGAAVPGTGRRWPGRPPACGLALLGGGAPAAPAARSPASKSPNPDWRLLFWVHAGLLTVLSLAFFAWAGGGTSRRHFAFPVAFLLLAVPWAERI